ncbi:uncharacterized protein LOC120274507 [Dioscorea cayenensis subsp. rotundata]|uniref:Uncharacterized protein LOC120274507 n=1 Tax=Dioscorea cayennensis subsp. rotundata TaxID=55577 RepID=A0AB40CBM8_DIOCR|nr:uncharacterized protein LOC120274507 [Dioscorea cayenensis subsp. rotundata]
MLTLSRMIIIPDPKIKPHLQSKRNGKHGGALWAKKPDLNSSSHAEEPTFIRLGVPNVFLARAAIAVFSLGFLDAGYSGDWSRIGAISKETEDLLKFAAYLVVPLCLLLIFSISDKDKYSQ